MMKQTMEIIYCMQCASLVPADRAAFAFRTGYYRVGIPLGQCAACAGEPAGTQRQQAGQTRLIPLLA
jgi:hypothetical protein